MSGTYVNQSHILVVDSNPATRDAVAMSIAACPEMLPIPAASAATASAILMAQDSRVAAVVVGLDLADEPATAFCQRLRRHGLRLPMVVVAANLTENDIIDALDAGANDVVGLPHRPAELRARLRAHMRCHAWCDDIVLTIGPYKFEPGQRLLRDPDTNRRIRLTDKETAVLKYLYRAGGVPVGRRALLREVWGYAPGATTHTVETHIYRLRRKIEPDPSRTELLLNDGGGYRLAAGWRKPLTRSSLPASTLEMLAAQ